MRWLLALLPFCFLSAARLTAGCEPHQLEAGSGCDGIDNDCNGEVDDCNENFSPPVFDVCPETVILECPEGLDDSDFTGRAQAHDDCGAVDLRYFDDIMRNCGKSVSVLRRWIATDDCGTVTECQQVITILDSIPPRLQCPRSVTLPLGSDTAPSARVGRAIARDACGRAEVRFYDAVAYPCDQRTVITRTWQAVDECENVSECQQTIVLSAVDPPELTAPPDVTIACGADLAPDAVGGPGRARSDASTLTYTDERSSSCGHAGVVNRLWCARDDCGNEVVAKQRITLTDTVAPLLSCDLKTVGENLRVVFSATDECGEASVYGEIQLGNEKIPVNNGRLLQVDCGPDRTKRIAGDVLYLTGPVITLIVTATDGCGNTEQVTRPICADVARLGHD